METKQKTDQAVIGRTEYVEIAGIKDIPAKIDTGADSSSIWVSNIDMQKDGTLSFTLFGEKSPLFTGKTIKTKEYLAKVIRSAHGDEQIRYRVSLPLKLCGKTFDTCFTLSNRTNHNYPVLIGRRTIEGRFIVDVSKSSAKHQKSPRSIRLNKELKTDPYSFHQKYFKNKGRA